MNGPQEHAADDHAAADREPAAPADRAGDHGAGDTQEHAADDHAAGDSEPADRAADHGAGQASAGEAGIGTPRAIGRRGALRIGTRGSPLALRQAALVAEAISGEAVEIVVLRTGGDLGHGGDKRRWVDTIEAALLEGAVDLAVHSAKDLPAQLAAGLVIAGSPARADARDALCGAATVSSLPAGARVGTSSLRRRAQLLALRPDLRVGELHGNVGTRLRRLADGDFDAIVLAGAGLTRLGLGGWLPTDALIPAAGQGTLAIEARAGDERVARAIAGLRDEPSERALAAERALVRGLGAGCDTPLGAHAVAIADGRLELRAFVGAPDGSSWIRDSLSADAADGVALGESVATRLLSAGAGAMLG